MNAARKPAEPLIVGVDGAEGMPSRTVCMVCTKTLEHLDTACERAECPLRPRRAKAE